MIYECKVLNELGSKQNVTMEANDEISLKALLKRQGYILIHSSIVKEKKPNTFLAVSSKVKITEVIAFLRQFAVMIKATIPISESLNVLRNQKHFALQPQRQPLQSC